MLKLVDLIDPDLITLDLQARTKNKVFEEMMAVMSSSSKVLEPGEFSKASNTTIFSVRSVRPGKEARKNDSGFDGISAGKS